MIHKEIGGYFGLEFRATGEYYPDAISLNSGRNCLKYVIKAQKISKIYMPSYMDKSLKEESIMHELKEMVFYNINKNFEIEEPIVLKRGEKILYNNYFSLKNDYVSFLAKKYGNGLIVDNTQAFFSRPLENIDTFYSLGSKYFGVPGGGYLFTKTILNQTLEQDTSYNNMLHLLGRIDVSAEKFFMEFQKSKTRRNNKPIRRISNITKAILSSINYKEVKLIRERNFYYMHSYFKNLNELKFDASKIEGPMVYPLLLKNENLRQDLINNKVYVPTYWKEILDLKESSPWEKYLEKYLLPLPVDQRYGLEDMKFVVNLILKLTEP